MASQIDYEKFYDQVGKRLGWDFSKIKTTTSKRYMIIAKK